MKVYGDFPILKDVDFWLSRNQETQLSLHSGVPCFAAFAVVGCRAAGEADSRFGVSLLAYGDIEETIDEKEGISPSEFNSRHTQLEFLVGQK